MVARELEDPHVVECGRWLLSTRTWLGVVGRDRSSWLLGAWLSRRNGCDRTACGWLGGTDCGWLLGGTDCGWLNSGTGCDWFILWVEGNWIPDCGWPFGVVGAYWDTGWLIWGLWATDCGRLDWGSGALRLTGWGEEGREPWGVWGGKRGELWPESLIWGGNWKIYWNICREI